MEKSLKNSDTNFEQHLGKRGRVKVLYLPLCNTFEKQAAMRYALKDNGYNVYAYDFRCAHMDGQDVNKRLLEIAVEFKPDIMFCQLQFSPIVRPETLVEIKKCLPNIKMINWTGDIYPYAVKYFTKMSKNFDHSFISSTGQLDLYKNAGCQGVGYFQIGYDEKRFFNYHTKRDLDIVMVASRTNDYTQSKFRDAIVWSFKKAFGKRFSVWGRGYGEPLPFYDQQEIYNRAKIVLSVNNENVENYFSDRQLISMACGPLVLTHRFPNEYWTDREHLVYFDTVDDAIKKARYYLDNDDERKVIGRCGAADVKTKHTYFHRVEGLKEILEPSHEYDLSVCLGTKNRSGLITRCLNSIFESAGDKRVEVVICNAGEDINIQMPHVRVIRGSGPLAHDYNLAFKEAKGKYVTWLSDDIMCEKTALSDMVDYMERFGIKDMGAFRVRHPGRKEEFTYVDGVLCPVVGCMRTETLKNIGYWSEEDYPIYGGDIEICNRVWRSGGTIYKTDSVLSHLHEQDDTRKCNLKNNIDDTSKFYLQSARYGHHSANVYPRILLTTEDTADSIMEDIYKKIKTHYSNAFYYGVNVDVDGVTEVAAGGIYDIVVKVVGGKPKIEFPSKLDLGKKANYVKDSFIRSLLT